MLHVNRGKSRHGHETLNLGAALTPEQCDEGRPICSKCKSSSRPCVYETKKLPKWKDKVGVLVLSPMSKPSRLPKIQVMGLGSQPLQSDFSIMDSITWTNYEAPGYQLSTMPMDDRYTFRSEDSSLLGHFMSRTSCGLVGTQEIWMQQALTLAFHVSSLQKPESRYSLKRLLEALINSERFPHARHARPIGTSHSIPSGLLCKGHLFQP